MARNITTVTHADGTVSTRTSAKAVYTHAVVITKNRAALAALAAEGVAKAQRHLAAIQADIEHGERRENATPWTFGGERVTVYLGSTYAGAYITPAAPLTDEQVLDAVRDAEDRARTAVGVHEQWVREVEEGPEFIHEVLRWSSRADLAEKATREFESVADHYGARLDVVPVD